MNLFAKLDPGLRGAIAISLGAIPGALSRYYLTLLFARWFGTQFPYGTFFINITGATIMGFFVTYFLSRGIGAPELRLFFAVGFLGSYTTFSTYALETSILLKSGNHSFALIYWLGSAAIGYLGLELGSFLARKLI
ncbi:fluoride efflux transporter CrcB [Leptolyngbya sp. AN03gr2]|uniref:fluoride efflux transporter CrcB n=1 Tax=unclassified Leptolyngbya TaxID=2650499 RepID=UPI003D319219